MKKMKTPRYILGYTRGQRRERRRFAEWTLWTRLYKALTGRF